MSSYPPGVTGNEPQIAGPLREVSEERTCEAGDIWVSANQLNAQAIEYEALVQRQMVGRPALFTLDVLDRLQTERSSIIRSGQLVECEFSGEVDVAYWGDYTLTWTCPRCGHQHEETVDE